MSHIKKPQKSSVHQKPNQLSENCLDPHNPENNMQIGLNQNAQKRNLPEE